MEELNEKTNENEEHDNIDLNNIDLNKNSKSICKIMTNEKELKKKMKCLKKLKHKWML